jgi:hypothetical protein
MAEFDRLGVTRISGEVVKANCRRALKTALMPVRTDIEIPLTPPLERRSFSDLASAWALSIEQAINRNDPQKAPAPAEPLEQA